MASGLKPADLADQLGSDRAAGAGNQDPLAPDELRDPFLVQIHFLTADEVLEGDLPDRVDGDRALDQLPDAGERSELLPRSLAELDDPAHLVSPG